MNKFYERATVGAVPSVKFEFLTYWKIKIYTDEKRYVYCGAHNELALMYFLIAPLFTFHTLPPP